MNVPYTNNPLHVANVMHSMSKQESGKTAVALQTITTVMLGMAAALTILKMTKDILREPKQPHQGRGR